MTIYVGNLSKETTENDLRNTFKAFGTVEFVNLIRDRFNKISLGFGMVGMPDPEEAQAAITSLQGKTIRENAIVVHAAGTHSR
jgi:RNA recognition motif-containing protein